MKNIVRDDLICQCTQRKLNFLFPFFSGSSTVDAYRHELPPYMSLRTFPDIREREFTKSTAAAGQIAGSVLCTLGGTDELCRLIRS